MAVGMAFEKLIDTQCMASSSSSNFFERVRNVNCVVSINLPTGYLGYNLFIQIYCNLNLALFI